MGRRAERSGEVIAHGRLLSDRRTQAILLALAEGPRRPCELESLPGIARSTLFLRLGELKTVGVVLARELSQFPLRIAYGLSERGRVALADALLSERRQQRVLATGTTGAKLGDLLRCVAPITHVDRAHAGLCVLIEQDTVELDPPVRMLVAGEDMVVLDESELPPSRAAVSIAGRPERWERALITGSTDGMNLEGDRDLAAAVLTGLSLALNT